MFTDLEGHTEMMQRLGDKAGRTVLREHEQITRQALARHGGSEIKTMGDGFLASFASAEQALDCAVALQQALAARPGESLAIRIGINAGEPIEEDRDLFGASIIAAARIADRAAGRKILVSDVVRQLVAGKGFGFTDAGEQTLKGITEPTRLWELDWEESLPA
jgi:class 3 adenylate cyclase